MRFKRFSATLFALALPALALWFGAQNAVAQLDAPAKFGVPAQLGAPAQYAPLAPELLLNKIVVAASNTPTQTTIISVTNPLTGAAGVAVTIY